MRRSVKRGCRNTHSRSKSRSKRLNVVAKKKRCGCGCGKRRSRRTKRSQYGGYNESEIKDLLDKALKSVSGGAYGSSSGSGLKGSLYKKGLRKRSSRRRTRRMRKQRGGETVTGARSVSNLVKNHEKKIKEASNTPENNNQQNNSEVVSEVGGKEYMTEKNQQKAMNRAEKLNFGKFAFTPK